MIDKNHPPIIQNDEIDLLHLIAYFLKIIRQNLVMLIILIAIGAVITYIYLALTPPIYKTQMIANSHFTDDKEIKAIFIQLDELAKEKNYDALAQKLKITVEDSKLIKGFNSYGITGENNNPNLPNQKDSVFVIEVFIAHNDLIQVLNNNIPKYLSNIAIIQKKYQTSKQADTILLRKIQKEIIQIDTIKKQLGQILTKSTSNFINFQLAELYNQSLRCYEREAFLNKKLSLEAIEIIEKFAPTQKPTNLKLKTILPISIASILFIWIILIFIKEINAALKKKNYYQT